MLRTAAYTPVSAERGRSAWPRLALPPLAALAVVAAVALSGLSLPLPAGLERAVLSIAPGGAAVAGRLEAGDAARRPRAGITLTAEESAGAGRASRRSPASRPATASRPAAAPSPAAARRDRGRGRG